MLIIQSNWFSELLCSLSIVLCWQMFTCLVNVACKSHRRTSGNFKPTFKQWATKQLLGHFYPPPQCMKKIFMQQATSAQVDECCIHAIGCVFCIHRSSSYQKKKMTYIFKHIIVSLSLQVKLMKVFYTLHTDINFFSWRKKILYTYMQYLNWQIIFEYFTLYCYNYRFMDPFSRLNYQRIGFFIWILQTLHVNVASSPFFKIRIINFSPCVYLELQYHWQIWKVRS